MIVAAESLSTKSNGERPLRAKFSEAFCQQNKELGFLMDMGREAGITESSHPESSAVTRADR